MAVSERRGNHCPEECGMISIVVAMDANQLIGANHKMPWHCPADLAHFRQLTLHHHLLMGRVTYEHLPKRLDHRILHVAGHKPLYDSDVLSCSDAQAFCREWKKKEEVLYVCGGAQIYAAAIAYADELWITRIEQSYTGDTWFPAFCIGDFRLLSNEQKEGCSIMHYRRR